MNPIDGAFVEVRREIRTFHRSSAQRFEAKLEPVNETPGMGAASAPGYFAQKRSGRVFLKRVAKYSAVENFGKLGGFMAKLMFVVLIILLVFSNAFGAQAMKGLEVKPRSFRWRALVSPDAGKSWQLRQEMSVRRTGH